MEKEMRLPDVIRRNIRALVVLSAIGSLGILYIVNDSIRSIDEISTEAIGYYGGDRISALIKYVDDPGRSFRRRNRAIWALSQLGDSRALPVLEKHLTGRECRHGTDLCQKELKKAIVTARQDAGPHIVYHVVHAVRNLILL